MKSVAEFESMNLMPRSFNVSQASLRLYLIQSGKSPLSVSGEGGGLADRVVRRIQINEGAFREVFERGGVVALEDGHVCGPEVGRNGSQPFFVDDIGVLVSTERGVELSSGVDTVQAVEAGLIEIDDAACPLHRRQMGIDALIAILSSHFVEVFRRVLVLFQVGNESLNVILDDSIDVHEPRHCNR